MPNTVYAQLPFGHSKEDTWPTFLATNTKITNKIEALAFVVVIINIVAIFMTRKIAKKWQKHLPLCLHSEHIAS